MRNRGSKEFKVKTDGCSNEHKDKESVFGDSGNRGQRVKEWIR